MVEVFPRGCITKFWSRFGVKLSQFFPGRLESRRYVSAKVGENSALSRWLSVVSSSKLVEINVHVP